jgi:hypothetical protein
MLRSIFFAAALTFCFACQASALSLDFSNFIVDPAGSQGLVDTSTSGELTIREDPSGAIFVADDSFFVDPLFLSLTFNYQLNLSALDSDFFVVNLNGVFPPVLEVGPFDPLMGSFFLDLTPFAGDIIGLAFSLEPDFFNDLGFDSMLFLTDAQINVIPEPGTLLLMAIGLPFFARFVGRVRKA